MFILVELHYYGIKGTENKLLDSYLSQLYDNANDNDNATMISSN